MAALVFVLMVPVSVGVLVVMRPRLVLVLMPVMAVSAGICLLYTSDAADE